jgi:hypothetical protein
MLQVEFTLPPLESKYQGPLAGGDQGTNRALRKFLRPCEEDLHESFLLPIFGDEHLNTFPLSYGKGSAFPRKLAKIPHGL